MHPDSADYADRIGMSIVLNKKKRRQNLSGHDDLAMMRVHQACVRILTNTTEIAVSPRDSEE